MLKKHAWIFSMALLSCISGPEPEPIVEIGEATIAPFAIGNLSFRRISGTFTTDYTLTKDIAWVLSGPVFVGEGATLTVEAGTQVYGAFKDATAFLSVLQGGKLQAIGTAKEPIRFTSIRKLTSIPQPGDWGGLIINGRAPINVPGGTAEGEGQTGTYGGSSPNDNSGTLRYVLINYAGKQLSENNELNSLSLNGVGNGTTVEYIQALFGKDDGIEIFGGTVNLRYVASLGSGDDSFDWSQGWTGMGQFWIAQQDVYSGDKGIEADNLDSNNDALPRSSPRLSNITLIGQVDADTENTGIMLREGTAGSFNAMLVTNFSRHGLVVDASAQTQVGNGDLTVHNSLVFDNNRSNVRGRNFQDAGVIEADPTNGSLGFALKGYIGVSELDSYDPTIIDPWFLPAPYIGAVAAADDWTQGWVEPLR